MSTNLSQSNIFTIYSFSMACSNTQKSNKIRRCSTTLSVLLIYCSIKLCNAQLLSAYEQAYGPWKIQLTRSVFGKKWYLQLLEPRDDAPISSREPEMKNSDLQLIFPPTSIIERTKDDAEASLATKAIRSVTCVLMLEKRGKFTIHIDDETLKTTALATSAKSNDKSPSTNSLNTIVKTENQTNIYSPLRGEWYLTPNPYCVTDRQYDTLTLIAEPRTRHAQTPEGIITEMAKIEMRCKLWGRYGVGAVRNMLGMRHGREMGRLTHGTVLVVREYLNDRMNGDSKRVTKREIIASFAGRGMLSENELGNNNDCSQDEQFANCDVSEDEEIGNEMDLPEFDPI
jgi:hypothetical protein